MSDPEAEATMEVLTKAFTPAAFTGTNPVSLVLVTFGGQTKTDEGVPSDDILFSQLSAQILEVKRSHTPDIVFELTIRDPSTRYTIFRSERLLTIDP
jgi:hypothetical protein